MIGARDDTSHGRDFRVESERDQEASPFASLLRKIWTGDRAVLAATLVDNQGECVDYCASIAAYEAKVAGAQLQVTISNVARHWGRAGLGAPHELHIAARHRHLVVRRLSDEYSLVVVLDAAPSRSFWLVLESTVKALREEADMDEPSWEPHPTPLQVEVRPSAWGYAPRQFVRRGVDMTVAAVLGRWVDEEVGGLVCFRVRLTTGDEMTLAHDPRGDRWMLFTDS